MPEADLGKLVTFDKRRHPQRSEPVSDTSTGGQVLIFTGVRYERGVPPVPRDGTTTTPARPKRKRG